MSNTPPLFRIFSDESRQNKERYMILGAIIIPEKEIKMLNATMNQYRIETKMPNELKWSKVNDKKLEEYKLLVDYFFALNNTNKIHFKSIIIDNNKIKNIKHSQENKEQSFYKFHYQLFFHKFGKIYFKMDKMVRFVIHPDYRDAHFSLDILKRHLNGGMGRHFNDEVIAPFVSIQPIDSKKSEIIQIVDLIIGAIGYEKNGYHLHSSSSKGKIELCKYIAYKAGIKNLSECTSFSAKRFEIWNIKFNKENRP